MANELQSIEGLLKEISKKVDDLPANLKIAAKQVFANTLSEISSNAGVLTAGEFRVGNGKEPGSGFTGVRMAYPALLYDGDYYPFVSVNNDILEVGISLADGKFYAGEGVVTLDNTGIKILTSTKYFEKSAIKFMDTSNTYAKIWAEYIGNARYGYVDVNGIDFAYLSLRASTDNFLTSSEINIGSDTGVYGGITFSSTNYRFLSSGILIGGDTVGLGGYVGLTNTTSSVSTGTGTVKMGGSTARDSTGWLKIMVGTSARYVPFWTDIS